MHSRFCVLCKRPPLQDLDDIEPSATCVALLDLEERGQLPTSEQLVPPGTAAASPTDANPTHRNGGGGQGVSMSQQSRASTSQQSGPPPAKRVRLSPRQARAREESGLLHLLQDSTREMARTCTRPHLDLSKPSIAFAVSLGNDLETMLPPHLQIVAKARFYETILELRDSVNDEA